MSIRELIVLSGHVWPSPPDRQSLDLPILKRLAEKLNARLSVVVRGHEARPSTYAVDHHSVIYLPARWSTLRFLWSTRRVTKAMVADASSPLVLTSDVLGAALGLLVAPSMHVAMVVQIQGDILAPGPEYGGRLRRLVIGWVIRRAIAAADGIRCLNGHIADFVSELKPKGLVRVIGSRVDVDRFRPSGDLRQEDRPVILCVGTLAPRKNQRVLVDALILIHEEFPSSELWLVGTGPMENALRRRAAEQGITSAVHFKGRIDHRDMPPLLRLGSILALPSLSEGEPRTVLEAQATGVPVVVADIPGTRGIVEDHVTGRRVRDFNPSTWAAIILEVLSDTHQREDLAANALARVRRENALGPWLERFASFLREVAERS